MPRTTQQLKQEVLARAGLVLGFFILMLCAVVAFFAGAPVLVVLVFGSSAALLLATAIFAGQKVALLLGRVFPLG